MNDSALVYMGHSLGAGSISNAKKYLKGSFLIAFSAGVIIAVIVVLTTPEIARAFLSDEESVNYMVNLLRLAMISLPGDYG